MMFLFICIVFNDIGPLLHLLMLSAIYSEKEFELTVVISKKMRITMMIKIIFTY